jgi:hypothetical protein
MIPKKERAEQIILEILRQAGETGLGRGKLYKAFWLAHLFYALTNRGYLSDWRIVRMPRGPGVDQGEHLIRELVAAGKAYQVEEWAGPFRELRCRCSLTANAPLLSDEARDAIKKAYEFVKDKTAAELSEYSHAYSRSWRQNVDGNELDIYSDLIPEDEYAERMRDFAHAKESTDALFQ